MLIVIVKKGTLNFDKHVIVIVKKGTKNINYFVSLKRSQIIRMIEEGFGGETVGRD